MSRPPHIELADAMSKAFAEEARILREKIEVAAPGNEGLAVVFLALASMARAMSTATKAMLERVERDAE